MKRDKVIQKIVYAVLIIITILFPYNVFAATNSSSDADPNEYAPKCKSYLGISITASAYQRSTSISTNVVSSRTISMTCKGRCKYYIYYSDYGNLEKLESDNNTKTTSEDDEDADDLVKVKKKTFTDSASWTLPAGKEALVVVISLNNKKCVEYDSKNKDKCIKWEYPKKIVKEKKCDNQGKNCKWENVKFCSKKDDSGKCKVYSDVTCPRGRFNTDDDPTTTDEVNLKGNGAALFIQNPKESGLVENLRHRNNSEFGNACKNAYNGVYDSPNADYKNKYSITDPEELNDYRVNYYGKTLSYCEATYVPFNLKSSQIKKISNNLLEVFYSRKTFADGQYKDLETIGNTITELENYIKGKYGSDNIFDKETNLTTNLSCDKKASKDTEVEYLYKTKEEKITAELSTGTVPVCTTRCYEHLTVKYNPPAVVKAGLCFSYKVTIKSVSECGIKDEFDLSKVGVPTMCSPSPICENSASHTQAGPSEDFDNCIKECDDGKYTQTCINKCYKKVYGNSKSTTKNTKNNKQDIVMSDMLYSKRKTNVMFIANNNDYSESYLKKYYKENNNENCTTSKIINYVKNGNSSELNECAEYFFEAKALFPYGNYNKEGTQWNPTSPITDAGATDESTTNIPMQIGRASPFYLRSVSETVNTLTSLVGTYSPVWKKYNITSHGIKRQYSWRYKCNQSCSYTGCNSGDIFTSSKFSDTTADDLQKLTDALKKCKVTSSCDSKIENNTSTFEIKVNAKRDSIVSENETLIGKTELHKTTVNENPNMFVSEYKNGLDNGILGLCYDNRQTPHYQTTITYPGTWINYKTAQREYKEPTDQTYFLKKNYYCTPYDASNVNEEYFTWAIRDNYNKNAYPNNFTPEYNIETHLGKGNNGFGKYNWKINFNCFYSLFNCVPGTKNCPSTTEKNACNDENSTRLCNTIFRVVDSNVLFPDSNGREITDENQLPFNWTSAAQDKDVINNPALVERGYGINPKDYKERVKSTAATAFDNSRSTVYHIHLTKDNIRSIKTYAGINGYTKYAGSYTKVEGIEGLYYYTMNSEVINMFSQFNRNTQQGYNQ